LWAKNRAMARITTYKDSKSAFWQGRCLVLLGLGRLLAGLGEGLVLWEGLVVDGGEQGGVGADQGRVF
jgi:hypothetical protein